VPTLLERFIAYSRDFYTFHACRAAMELKITEHLSSGPLSVDDLASRAKTHAPSLFRLLRWLETVGVFKQVSSGVFANTADSEFLRKEAPGPLWTFLRTSFVCGFYRAFECLPDSIRSGRVAFELAHGCTLWEYLGRDPERAALFHQQIEQIAMLEGVTSAVTAAYDWSRFAVIADIGGGIGAQLVDILNSHASSRGILFDQPDVVARAIAHDRMERVSGSFFESVPAGADAYILRNVIHDWLDRDAGAILRVIRAAAKPSSRVILIERIIPETSAFDPGKLSDLLMLAVAGGQERTAAEYQQLLENTGLELEQIVPTPAGLNLIISRPRN